MHITPDTIIFFQWHGLRLNATIVCTWIVMGILLTVSLIATRKLSSGPRVSRWQTIMETVVLTIRSEIRNTMQMDPAPFLPFLGTLFLFISISNLLAVVPVYRPPTGSISTTAALATTVLLTAPVYGISKQGVLGFLKTYLHPIPIMLPLNILSDISRAIALSVRLFGNIMSGHLIAAIMIGIIPLIFPLVLDAIELLLGQIQAYIFTVLSSVILAAAVRPGETDRDNVTLNAEGGTHG
ncbi:MAG: F0F1 ATP synthase subunit A [Spirochaetes bacterium]|nr:F0F1 ATP synthase subunit A [Spirochaetota bacterium]